MMPWCGDGGGGRECTKGYGDLDHQGCCRSANKLSKVGW